MDDQEYYPLHEEDDVPETPDHEATARYARDALAARFPGALVTGNVCVYWERGNTRAYRAPDVLMVTEPLTEPVTRVYLLWKQPPIAFVLEVGSRTSFRTDVGPKVELYQEKIKAAEYAHVDLDHQVKRLWRLGPEGYVEAVPEANGRLRSQELELEFDLVDGFLRFFTPGGERLLTHEESEQQRREEARRRRAAEQQQREEARCRQEAEGQREAEARRRQEAEQQREEESRRRQEAEDRAAELARQLEELRAQLADRDGSST
jgi:Uma2 family endonuclease